MGGKAASVTAMASFKENSFYQQNKVDFFLNFPPTDYVSQRRYILYVYHQLRQHLPVCIAALSAV